jgi:hypothetical protein
VRDALGSVVRFELEEAMKREAQELSDEEAEKDALLQAWGGKRAQEKAELRFIAR